MTESKPPTSNRTVCPGHATSSATIPGGHNYSATNPQHLMSQRPKVIPTTLTPGTAVSAPPSIMSASPFRMTVPLVGGSKEPLRVTSFIPKGPTAARGYPIEKLTVPLNATPTDLHVKANVKNVGLQKVNFVKQIGIPRTPAPASIAHVPIKKNSEVMKPVFLGAGLRQPSKLHQPVRAGTYSLSPGTSVRPSSWAQPGTAKTAVSNAAATIVRMKPQFRNAAVVVPHDPSIKYVMSQQPKSTITPTAHMPLSLPGSKTELPASPLNTGSKPIYQAMANTYHTAVPGGHGSVKKIPSMIVSQAILLPLSNATTNTSAFVSPSSALPARQISVMASRPGISHSSSPAPLNKTSTVPIPVAKVYPQQQHSAKVSVTSTAGSRVSVPLISSVSPAIVRATPSLIQVGPVRSTSATSIFTTTPATIMPTALNKVITNSTGIGSVLRFPASFSQSSPMMTSMVDWRHGASVPSIISSGQPMINVTGATLVQQHSAMAAEPESVARIQAMASSAPSVLQATDSRTAGTGPSTPTMSPKPTILRRQRPENTNALRKLPFSVSPNFATQRRDLNAKPADRRPKPFALNTPKMSNSTDVKAGMPVVIQGGNIMKLESRDQQFNTSGSFMHKFGNNWRPRSSPAASLAQDGNHQSYSVRHGTESKSKLESGFQQNSEPASASQMLHFQSQSMHTYAAESPQVMSNTKHHAVSHASGHRFSPPKPAERLINFDGCLTSRPKPSAVVKNEAPQSSHSQLGSHDVNSVSTHRMPNRDALALNYIKREHAGSTAMPRPEQRKPIDGRLRNHSLSAASPSKSCANQTVGISPRKRPRKQTHVVSDRPVVMENEESTDDADEWEDEPVPDISFQQQNISTPPAVALPGQKIPSNRNSIKSEQTKKKVEEKVRKSSRIKSLPTPPKVVKRPSEYTDRDGVRYVSNRKRPSVSVLNRRKTTSRLGSNHYMRYSDIKVKRKKVTIADLAVDKKRLKGIKVARFALQLDDMVVGEKDVWNRMQAVCDGLKGYKSALTGDESQDGTSSSPSPGTSSTTSSLYERMPGTSRSGPATPSHRKSSRAAEEIELIEEVGQANLQRCLVVCDQLTETKKTLLKFVDHRQLVTDILDSSSKQRSPEQSTSSQTSKRTPRKKAAS